MKSQKKLLAVFAVFSVFALIIGFGMLSGHQALALEDDYKCESSDTNVTKDCDTLCQTGEANFTGGGVPTDCNGACDVDEAKDSPDCNEKCEGGENECSADCDPLGQCAFANETQLTSQDLRTVVARVINIILGLLGTIAVIIIIIGGFKWMTGGGNEDKVGEAKKLMAAGVVGLAIVLAAYSIASFVVKGLTEATQQ